MVTLAQFLGGENGQRLGRRDCPLHDSASRRHRPFSVNVAIGRYYCHQCHSHGNQLELWAAATKLPVHPAAIALCRLLGRDVPWVRRW
jgi:transposase-like protein